MWNLQAVLCRYLKEQDEVMETLTTVEVSMKQDTHPKLDKCCFCVSLRLGLNCCLAVECIVWIFLFVSSLYYETIYIDEVDLMSFMDETEHWYFLLIFGDRFYFLDQKTRTYIILVNFLLMVIFLMYLAFTVILLYGVNASKIRCFIPYFALDAIFVFLAVCGCLASFVASITHLFRVSFTFLVIKVYIELVAISLFKEYRQESSIKSETASVNSEEENQTTAV